MTTHHSWYRLHGLGLRVATDCTSIDDAVRSILRPFQVEEELPAPDLSFRLSSVEGPEENPLQRPPEAVKLSAIGGDPAAPESDLPALDLYRVGTGKLLEFSGHGSLHIDETAGRVEGSLVTPNRIHRDVLASWFRLALTELLRHRGLYAVHATALEKGGRGLLIPGHSGRGKTTCCVSLLRAGYNFLADDHPLVRDNGTSFDLLAFPEKIDVADQTVAFFPELRDAPHRLHPGLFKRYFRVDDVYPGRSAAPCRPDVLLAPRISGESRSRVEALPRREALQELMYHGLMVFDKAVARQQFQSFARLVREMACYRLHFGADVLELPGLVDGLMERA